MLPQGGMTGRARCTWYEGTRAPHASAHLISEGLPAHDEWGVDRAVHRSQGASIA